MHTTVYLFFELNTSNNWYNARKGSEMNAFKVCVKYSQQDPESKAAAKGENG